MKVGVFIVCMPDYTSFEAMEMLGQSGCCDGVELRVTKDEGDFSNPSFWSGNRTSVSAEDLLCKADEFKAKAAECGLDIPSLGSYIDCSDLDIVETNMKAAVAVGAKSLRISPGQYNPGEGSYLKQLSVARESYAKVAELAAQYGLKALIETHARILSPSVSKARAILEGLDPKYTGIMWDPANQIGEGLERIDMAIDIAGEYLAEVHFKNLTWSAADEEQNGAKVWSTVAAPLKQGIVNWPDVVCELRKSGYDGWFFLEDFSITGDVENTIKDTLSWMKGLVAE